MDAPYVTCETWMICPSHMQQLRLREWAITGRLGIGWQCEKST